MRTILKLVIALMLLPGMFVQAQTLEDGVKAMENENYKTARDIFQKVSNADPANASALFYLGEALFKTGDVAAAQSAYDKCVVAQPTEYNGYIGQAKCMLDNGNVKDAEKKIAMVVSASKGKDQTILCYIAEAYAFNKNHDWVKGIEYAQKAIGTTKGKDDFRCYNTLGDIYYEKHYSGNGDDKDAGYAVSNFEKSYQLNPKSAYAITKVGKIWSTTRNDQSYKLAEDALNKAKAANPDYVPMHGVWAYLYQISGQFEKAKAEQEIYMAGCEDKIKPNDRMINILYKLKDWNGAYNLALKMNSNSPGNCDYIRVLAHTSTELGKGADAVNYFDQYQKKCDVSKMDIEDYIYMAKAQKAAGNDSLSNFYFYKVIGMDSTREQSILKEMARGYYAARKYAAAAEVYKKLCEKYPTPDALFRLADSYYSLKKYKECGVVADTFMAQNPALPLGYLFKARSLYYTDTLNERKASADAYKVFLEKAADTAVRKTVLTSEIIEAHKQLIQYQIKKNNLKGALEQCDLALKDDPNNESIQNLKTRIEKAIANRNAPAPKPAPGPKPAPKPKGK